MMEPTTGSFPVPAGFASFDALANMFAGIASQAGRVILAVYGSDFTTRQKSDASPVCEADEAAERLILRLLKELLPEVPIVSEEAVAGGVVPDISSGVFVLVDPLDGTVEFAGRNGEFTVNIALIVQGTPVCGIVYSPLDGTLYLGGEHARKAQLTAGASFDPAHSAIIRVRQPGTPLDVVMSRSHRCSKTEAFADAQGENRVVTRGSALKFGLLADGSADLYPRFTPTMEWDTAAGHAVLQAAGGSLLTPDDKPFVYGKIGEGFRNGPFIARGGTAGGAKNG